ncbi:hypothetical protein J1P26_20540 [Neobacillus sp. MM2021_6]|uniref:hypothetical protein n=1 Tax=Bacillaceae TaxID=186817 RepID=UPI00140DA0DB|nr:MULTISPECIES: hypothetical protein [Bacillaceae]MBO0962099.1 hypothetical protein [Neobacillus sp. MM2021_6]
MVEKEQVVFLSNGMEQTNFTLFDIKKLDVTIKNFLPGFQKGKEAISGFEVTKRDNTISYIFTFIHSGENYYLVIYTKSKKAVVELKNVEVIDGNSYIVWKYSPAKRDGKNQERKDYFKKHFGSAIRQIFIPNSPSEIEAFIGELFALSQSRLKADHIGEENDTI